MIDFDKLKEAHDMLFKLRAKESKHVSIRTVFKSNGDAEYSISLGEAENNLLYEEDELIATLKELIKPEPKYKIGDMVCYSKHGELKVFVIYDLSQNANAPYDVVYFDNDEHVNPIHESHVYHTRQALIESQVNYWMALYHYVDKEFIADTSKANIEETKTLFKETMQPPFEGNPDDCAFTSPFTSDHGVSCEKQETNDSDLLEPAPCKHKPDSSSCQGENCDCPKQCEKCGGFFR